MLRNECGTAAESKGENIRGAKWRPADRRTGGRAERTTGRRFIRRWNGVPSRGLGIRGHMRTDLDVGPVRRGIRQWRDRVLCPRRGKCRVYHVRARIP